MSSGNTLAGEEVSRLIIESGCRTGELARAMNVEARTVSRWKHRRVDPPSYAPAAVKWGLLVLGKSVKVRL